MNTDQVKSEIQKAADSKAGRLFVEGYVDSSGAVTNKTVKLLDPSTGLDDLTKESREKIESLSNPSFDAELWDKAKEELIKSFEKRLSGQHGNPVHRTVTYEQPEDTRWALKNGNPDLVVVFHVQEEKNEEVVQSPLAGPNKRELTKVKDYIREKLPIGSYKNQLLLTPSKYKSVEALDV